MSEASRPAPDGQVTSSAGGVVALGISTAAFVIGGYVGNIFLAKLFPPGVYGNYGILTALMTALNIIQVSGLPQAVSRSVAGNRRRAGDILRTGLKVQLVVSAVLVLAFLLAAPGAATLLGDPGLIGLIRLTGLILPFYGAYTVVANGYYNGLRRFTRQAGAAVVYAVAKLVLIVAGALTLGLTGVLLAFILAPAVALAAYRPRPTRVAPAPARPLVVVALPLMGYSLLAFLSLSIDLFLVKAMIADPAQAGYYTAAQSVATIPYWVVTALNQVLFPAVAGALAADRRADAGAAVNATLRYYLLTFLPVAALLIGSAPVLLPLLYRSSYLAAVPALRVLVLAYFPLTLFALLATVLNAAGRGRTALLLAGAAVVVTVAGCLLLIPRLGLVGAAMSTGAGVLLAVAGAWWRLTRLLPLRIPPVSALRALLAAGIVLALAAVPTPGWALPLWWVLCGLVYLSVLSVTREVNAADRERLTSVLPSRFRQRGPHGGGG